MRKPSMAPGFRFHPTDIELVTYYLKRKILGKKMHFKGITEIDILKYPPWDLPAKSSINDGDLKWYFFYPLEKKYASGGRMNRATEIGFWKTTGNDRPVNYNNEVVGMIKTLIFHIGRAQKVERTDWVIHEYRLVGKICADNGILQNSYVLCKVFKKDGPGPRNSAQYGAPFKEEDWTDDEEENGNGQSINVNTVGVLPSSQTGTESVARTAHAAGCSSMSNIPYTGPLAAGCSSVSNIPYTGPLAAGCSSLSNISYSRPPAAVCSSVSNISYSRPPAAVCSSVSNISYAEPLAARCSSVSNISYTEPLVGCSSVSNISWAGPLAGDDVFTEKQVSQVDDIEAMLALFTEEECNDSHVQKDKGKGIHCTNGTDIYEDLGDLGNLAALCEDDSGTSAGYEASNTTRGQMLPLDDVAFLEMIDLDTPVSCPNELFKDGYNYL